MTARPASIRAGGVPPSEPLLSVRELSVDYVTATGALRAVDRVSFDLRAREILGIVGESGSGKSTVAQALLRVLPPPAVISHGHVLFEGRDLLSLTEQELQAVRWERISMVFQSAMDALNPVLPAGEQIVDTLLTHGYGSRGAARARAGELFELVDIPRDRLSSYPHQLSGGMRQRVAIALALALQPSLVILDEPTTALDVIVEREILGEIRRLQSELGFAVIFITHDLTRMLQFSDRVAVFYAARIVEIGPVGRIGNAPLHPYTKALLGSFPAVRGDLGKVASIPGAPPSLESPPSGCRFHPRCPRATEICSDVEPLLRTSDSGLAVACHHAEGAETWERPDGESGFRRR